MSPYPTEEDLARIKAWRFDNPGTFPALMDFIKSIWWLPDFGWNPDGERKFSLSTGGWSGNESIIYAMEKNENAFWSICWVQSNRGGHYVFELPDEVTFYRRRGDEGRGESK